MLVSGTTAARALAPAPPPPPLSAYGMANEVWCCGPGADRAKIKGSMKSLLSKAAMEMK